MPYVRVTRDQRGYENTFLLHVARSGERPQVLYWFRTAPDVRLGRAAFDEDAIRAIEDRNPEVDFDWPHLIEEAASAAPEGPRIGDRDQDRRRRRPQRREAAAEPAAPRPQARPPVPAEEQPLPESLVPVAAPPAEGAPPIREPNPLLESLLGREIANRLRTRYAELAARIREQAPDPGVGAVWQARADVIDPDRWSTPQAVLEGVRTADPLFEDLRREVMGAE